MTRRRGKNRRRSRLLEAAKRKLREKLEELARETPLERKVAEELLGPDADDPDRLGAARRVLAREKSLEERVAMARFDLELTGADPAELRWFYSLPPTVSLTGGDA